MDQLLCPNCGQTITITDALSKQLTQEIESHLKADLEKQQALLKSQADTLEKEKQDLKSLQQSVDEEVAKKIAAKELEMKRELWVKAQAKAGEEAAIKIKETQEQLEEQRAKNKQLMEQEMELRKKERQLADEKEQFELKIVRQLDEERAKIREEVQKRTDEEHRLKEMEKEKQLFDMKKQIEELKRKAEQGSQQQQGEVLELDLEKSLRDAFIHDGIEPVAKGVNGADIIQTVCNHNGSVCGIILWEVKQTKHWTESWIVKFKDDLRSQKANIPVLVATALPKDISGFGFYEGVWVTEPKLALALAISLRKGLVDVAYERMVSVGKAEKTQQLFTYVTSHEFRQRVEALVEVFTEMQMQVSKERMAFEKSWKQREGQLQRLFINTAGMYGEMQGLVGSAMPEIKGLELDCEPQKLPDGKIEEQTLF